MTLAPFVRTGDGVHPTIDLDRLRACYPDLPVDVFHIGSASDILGWLDMRAKFHIAAPDGVPCDLFVWGTGEAPDPRMTRVGGVPWLPKRTPWPRFGKTVATFLCQFDFRDSKDLHGQAAGGTLPGDLLLVFVAGEYSAMTGDSDELKFLWVSADETEVYTQADIPTATAPFDFVTAWGARYRSEDLPSQWDKAYDIPDRACPGRSSSLPVLWATKIGGVPYDSQEDQDAVPPGYLCQLVSIQPSDTSWPWVDHADALKRGYQDGEKYSAKQQMMIGDLGELTLYLRKDGTVTAHGSCG